MQRKDRLHELFEKVSKRNISKVELISSLQDLLSTSTYGYQREKLQGAIEWAEIYFSPRRWQKWGSIETVKGFVLEDIYKSMIAEDTVGSPHQKPQ